MPIPFHDADDVDALGAAAFLHVENGAGGARFGALLFLNARGEPLEFVYNRLELMSSVLWRSADRERSALARLAASLFTEATLRPLFLLCRAGAVDPHVFGASGRLALDIPVGRVATAGEAVGYTGAEAQETVVGAGEDAPANELHLFWTPAPPEDAARALLEQLAQSGLLLEPFERAQKGLLEVYGDLLAVDA